VFGESGKLEDKIDTRVEESKMQVQTLITLPKLIPQAVHDNLPAAKISDGTNISLFISQRDCVENLVRNVFNMSFLYSTGEMRPGVMELLTDSALGHHYFSVDPLELVSSDINCCRNWVNMTVGFEQFGVMYDPLHGNREVLTGIDNILSLMEGMTHKIILTATSQYQLCSSDRKDAIETADTRVSALNDIDSNQICCQPASTTPLDSSESNMRAIRLTRLCALLSTETISVSWNYSPNILNYSDVKISFRFHNGRKKCTEKVKWLITTDHVCLRHGNLLSS